LFGGYNLEWIFFITLNALAISVLFIDIQEAFPVVDLPKSELLLNFPLLGLSKNKFLLHQARLARFSWLKSQAGKLSDRQQRVLHLCG
jgi:hypothetical protein